jgi:methyl-accepting chemotaxis protein
VAAHENVAMISRQIELITEEIDRISDSAADMSGKEEKSQAIIKELAASNDQTKQSVDKVDEQISLMNQAVDNIKEAVGIIQSIADETDLLSLNASIEAARAGEAGRGFAVVAEQICRLAFQSNESGQDIERILGEITATSEKMVSVMEEVRTNMDMQQVKLEETRTTYQEVADGVEQSLGNIGNIKEKIDVLYASGNSISSAIEGLSAVSEQNAGSAANTMQIAENMSGNMQDVEASAEELLQLADKLQEALGSFRI